MWRLASSPSTDGAWVPGRGPRDTDEPTIGLCGYPIETSAISDASLSFSEVAPTTLSMTARASFTAGLEDVPRSVMVDVSFTTDAPTGWRSAL